MDNEQEKFQYIVKLGALRDQYPNVNIPLASRYDLLETLKLFHDKAIYEIETYEYLTDLRGICRRMLLLKLQLSMYIGDRDIHLITNVVNTFSEESYYKLSASQLHEHIWEIGDEIKVMHGKLYNILGSSKDELDKNLLESLKKTAAHQKIYGDK